jgi:outer membrane protein OmpA-like peptidoglycan-associated protein
MQNNPTANLTITGTMDTKTKFETPKVALTRAEQAKKYLMENYNIDAARITVKSTNLPAKASSSNDPEGIQENRRIEFASNNPAILAPIIIERDRQTVSTPRMIEFIPEANSTDSIAAWQLEIAQGDKVLRRFTGTGEPEAQQWMVLPNELAASEIPVDYTFTATNSAGKRDSKSGSIPVEYISSTRSRTEDTPDKIISKYSLNLFDFDSPAISESDKEILRKYVIPAIKYNSVVQVYGYTDRIGDEAYNKKLALQRAQNVKDFLSTSAKAIRYETNGLGEDVKLFDNNSPVGRHLSRTVQIYITTPKE